jgi:thiol-disulfide isomerase/thioredoxin
MSIRVLISFLCGVLVALLVAQQWSHYQQRQQIERARVQIQRSPFTGPIKSFLPSPWFPGSGNEVHGDWMLDRVSGGTTHFRDLQGRVVFLNVWQTTCAPCLAEMPSIERLSRSLQAKIEVLAVSEENKAQVQDFLKKRPINVTVAVTSKWPRDILAEGFPRTFIFDKKGVIVAKFDGPFDWDNQSARDYLTRLASMP